jgi:thiol-disulfide isomerase/thioredoxin
MNPNFPNCEGAALQTSVTRLALLDLLAGLAAIVLIVGTSIRAAFVGSDLRALFVVSALAFYGAGVLRGRSGISSVWLKGLVVSSPGLLGTAALIMNDGLHRLPIPVAVSLVSITAAVAGVQSRRWWRTARRWSVLLGAAFLLTLGVGIPTGVPRLAKFASLKRVDRPETSFALSTFEGAPLRSQDLIGQVVVLSFWASWCRPCRWELPEVQAAYDRFRDNSRVHFLAVDVGWAGETTERGRKFLARQGLTLPAAFDAGEAAARLQVDSLPTLIVIDANGHIRMTHHGYDRSERVGEQVTQIVRELLAETGGREASSR